jgi:hypothetical protein
MTTKMMPMKANTADTPLPGEFGHIAKVHPKDACYKGEGMNRALKMVSTFMISFMRLLRLET